MSSRIIIPEIVGEGSGGKAQSGRSGGFARRPGGMAPVTGLGAMVRALAAGLVLVAGVATVMFLGGIVLIAVAVMFVVAWLGARLGGRRASGRTVVIRSTRPEGPTGRTILIERRYESEHGRSGDARRP